VGTPADVYSLGASLFWLLTGDTPYPATPHVGAALRQLMDDPPRSVRSWRSDVPYDVDELLAQMLERDPAKRPSAREVAERLDRILAEQRKGDVRDGHQAMLSALASLAASCAGDSAGHPPRLQEYARVLARTAATILRDHSISPVEPTLRALDHCAADFARLSREVTQ
jgi:serine/threonine protein kinase